MRSSRDSFWGKVLATTALSTSLAFQDGGTPGALLSVALVSGLATLLPAAAQAQSRWVGAVSSDWLNGANWSPIGVPASNVSIGSAPNPVILDGGTAQIGALYVGEFGAGTLTIRNGASLRDFAASYIGFSAGFSSRVSVLSDATWHTDTLYVGPSGSGDLIVTDGGKVITDQNAFMGYYSGSSGTVAISTSNSRWDIAGFLQVGGFGNGDLTISDGATVTNTSATIAGYKDVSSRATVTGNATWTNSSYLVVGDSGPGTLSITNGGKVSNTDGYIGGSFITLNDFIGSGAVTVNNGTWANAGTLYVGYAGAGTLAIQSGGKVSAAQGVFGRAVNAVGTVTVTGYGSTLEIVGNPADPNSYSGLLLGTGGTGILNIGAAPGDAAAAPGTVSARVISVGRNSSTINFNHTDMNYTFAVPIYDTGDTSNGTGTVNVYNGVTRLTGASTYSGATHVLGGALFVDGSLGNTAVSVASGARLSGSGSIAGSVTIDNGGVLEGRTGQTLTMGALTLNSGSIVNVALGAPGLARTFHVTGDLTLDGTLNVTNAGGFGAGVYQLFGYGGTLIDNGLTIGALPEGTTGAVQTAIANQVNLVVDGAAGPGETPTIQFWNGTATAANGTVNGGSGTWSAGAATNWTDANGTRADAWGGQFAVFQGAVGRVTVDGAAGAVVTTGMQFIGQGWTVTGAPLTLNGASATIRVGDGSAAGASSFATIDSVLTGNSRLVKDDLGTLILTADNAYTGGTLIKAGTLVVNGTVGGLMDVSSAGRLQGIGTVGDTIVSGTIAPGNSIGTLNVAGNIAFNPGSIYEVEANAAGQADRINASGTAAINGGSVRVLAGAGNYAPSTQYTILTASSGRTGAFEGVTSNLAFLDPSLSYDANNVYLTLIRNVVSFANVGITPNQISTGNGVESLGSGNPLYNGVLNLSADQARGAFDQFSGEVHASTKTALIENSRFVQEAVTDRMRSAFDAVAAANTPVMSYASGGPQYVPATSDRFALWGRGFGSWGHNNGDGNAARLNRSTGGFFVGGDGLVFDSWRLGLLAGYSRTDFNVRDRRSSGSSDNYHVGLYGGSSWNVAGGALAFRSGAIYTWHDISTSRSVAFPGFSDSLKGRYNAGTAQMFGEVAYGVRTGHLGFEPFANLAYVNLHTDSFRETGGAAALVGNGGAMDTTFSTLGLRASSRLMLGGVSATIRGSLGWRHAFGEMIPQSTMAFVGGSPFSIAGVPIARNAALVEASLDVDLTPSAKLGLSYGGQFSSRAIDQSVRGTLAVRF